MNKILIVDDDINIRELVRTVLTDVGFSVVEVDNGKSALARLGEDKIDLCILDIMMPQMDGYQFCEAVRKYYDFPILMLTAKGETHEKVKGFKLGADDYLTKPFDMEELLVRVNALLKRYNIAASQSVQIGQVAIDKSSTTVAMNGQRMDIPMKEFELLFFLASYAGKTLSRDRLIEEIWGYDFEGNERTLDVHIGRLRERFPTNVSGIQITTIRGLGYRLEVK